ncbi:reverse transcriptase domain-containing protein [Tanacetum coccineum]
MRQRFPEPLALLANTYNPHPSYSSDQTQYQAQPSKVYQSYQHYQSSTLITQQLIQSPPLQSYAPIVVQQPPTFQPDTILAIPTFLLADDPIASLNKAMIFLNRQSQGYTGNVGNNQASGTRVVNNVGNAGANQPRVIKCYNCNGEGHMAKQCTARKRMKDSEWFKEKMLLAQAQEAGVILNDEQQDFLADSLEETNDCEELQLQAIANFKADHVDAYDSDCDDEATANAIFMENLSPDGSLNNDTVAPRYDFDTLSEVPHYDTYHDSDVLNSNIQELGYIENIVSNNESYNELLGNNNFISYTNYMLTNGNNEDNYVSPPVQKNDTILSIIEQMKSQVEKCNKVNQEKQNEPESLTSELEQYKDRVRVLGYAVKDGHYKQEAYLSRELYSVINDRNRKVKGFIVEVKEMKVIFKQIEDEVDQYSVAKKSFEIEKKQLLINNDRLLEENIASDIKCTYLRSLNEDDNCGKCKSLDILREQLKGKFSESQMNHNGTSVNTKRSKPPTLGTKLYSVTLLPKSKVIPKVVKKNDLSIQSIHTLTTIKILKNASNVLAPGLLIVENCNQSMRTLRTIGLYVSMMMYLNVTKEHVATLQELLDQARALKPLDEHIGYASKFAARIRE